MIQEEIFISMEKSLKQVKNSLDLYYSYCMRGGLYAKAVSARNIRAEVSSLLDRIGLLKDCEYIPRYAIVEISKQLKKLVKSCSSWEVVGLFSPEQLSEIVVYSTFLEIEDGL